VHPALVALGPDLLDDDFSADEAVTRLRARPDMEIAEALADQTALAGIGNVYKSEILFIESVNPWTHVAELDDARLAALRATAHKLLLENVEPASASGPHRVTTRGDPAARRGLSVFVYGRANQPCARCRTMIRTRRQGKLNRPTYWCPRCQ